MGACASAPKTRGDGAWVDDVHDTSGHDSSHSGRGGARWFAAEPVDAVTTFTGRGERFARSRRDVDDAERLRERVATKTSARKARPFKYASTGGDHVLRSLDIDADARAAPPRAHGQRRSVLLASTRPRRRLVRVRVLELVQPRQRVVHRRLERRRGRVRGDARRPALNHVQPRNAHRRSRLSTTSASSTSDRSIPSGDDDRVPHTASNRAKRRTPGHPTTRATTSSPWRTRMMTRGGRRGSSDTRRMPSESDAGVCRGTCVVTGGSTRLGKGRTARCTGAKTHERPRRGVEAHPVGEHGRRLAGVHGEGD